MFAVHYKPMRISQLSAKDSKVALTGTVVQRRDGVFVLDDGNAKADIFFGGRVEAKTVRAFCTIADNRINADVVQNLDGMDLSLFNKVEDLYNKLY